MKTTSQAEVLKEIKTYWDTHAKEKGHLKNATIKDWYFRDLEVWVTSKYLKPSHSVIDIGCGNGGPTLQYASYVKEITGVDYSEPMIEQCIKNAKRKKIANAKFLQANALKLPFKDSTFDVAIMSRVLINIPKTEDQKKALNEAERVIKKGGIFILLEATQQGHETTNKIRHSYGLNDIKKHWHNKYIDETEFTIYMKRKFKTITTHRFSTYMFISKILNPLLAAPREPKFLSKMNKIAVEASKKMIEMDNLNIGHNFMWVLEKK